MINSHEFEKRKCLSKLKITPSNCPQQEPKAV